ncbi:DUF2235 domain-containing protein [Labilibacter sediminis]|nr:DUF2235 domain-containing protein [Labilibacter sediminis]
MKRDEFQREYIKDFDAPKKERKHIILIDGTWNDETGKGLSGLVTNIVNLQKILINDPDQIVRYHRGVGNDDDNKFMGTLWKGATGRGTRKIVDKAYARFVEDWQNGDEVYIFGFSRGAAAARLLAKKIYDQSVPKKITITYGPKVNRETKVIEQRIKKYDIEGPVLEPTVDIEFVGVWDTVSAFRLFNNIERFLRIKERDLFTDNFIAPNIKRAVQLVAIDETRNIFNPSLMNNVDGITHEVWFPGVHADLGGSYADNELAKSSLHYMLEMLKEHIDKTGAKPLLIDPDSYDALTIKNISKAHFHFHGLSWGKSLRKIFVQENGKPSETLQPKIHQSYQMLCTSNQTYSTVKKKKKNFHVRFQYMPINVKLLNRKFKIEK